MGRTWVGLARLCGLAQVLRMTTPDDPSDPLAASLRIRIVFGTAGMLGPGKADLLEGILRTGSIAAAGRDMGMSYKRAWELVGTLNAMFARPLVERSRGGTGGGGAVLTTEGQQVLDLFRSFEQQAAHAGAAQLDELRQRLAAPPAI